MTAKTLTTDSSHAIRPTLAEQCGVEPDKIQLVTVEIAKEKPRFNRAKVEEALQRIRAMPVHDDRTADEIIGYDEFGLPR